MASIKRTAIVAVKPESGSDLANAALMELAIRAGIA
jgi:hypothetical protein